MERETLRAELNKFSKNLVDGYVDDTTILELLGTNDVIDDYVDNQLKERWINSEPIKTFCGYCGAKLEHEIPTDINTKLVCNSGLCKSYKIFKS